MIGQRKKQGFTLVELLIVIIIIAVLAAIAIPKFSNSTQRAHESELRAKLKVVRDAVQRFNVDMGGYPVNLAQLLQKDSVTEILDRNGNIVAAPPTSQFSGPYLDPQTAGLNANGTGLIDPICKGTFGYISTGPKIGFVTPCAVGTASDGTIMANW